MVWRNPGSLDVLIMGPFEYQLTPSSVVVSFCATAGMYGLVLHTLMLLFRYWNNTFRHQPVSGPYQIARLSLWSLGVVITLFGGIFLLLVFGVFSGISLWLMFGVFGGISLLLVFGTLLVSMLRR